MEESSLGYQGSRGLYLNGRIGDSMASRYAKEVPYIIITPFIIIFIISHCRVLVRAGTQ